MTARRPWYKRFPSDFRAATASLPYGVKGTYSHVLDLIYDHGGPIDDRPSDIARALGCDRHTWRDHRAALIKAGKLFLDGGKLMNGRAARELGKIPDSTCEHTGKIPETNVSGTKPRKPKRGKALNGATAHAEKHTDTRSQKKKPTASSGFPKPLQREPRSLTPNGARAAHSTKLTPEEGRRIIREHNNAQAKKPES